jgi:uncharacterized protein with HEPN domain
MRTDQLYLLDIVEAAASIQRFLSGVTQDAFRANDLVQSAVLQKLIVLGEAASRLTADHCARHPQIDWKGIAGFRNIAVHAYFSVDWDIVWVAATEEAIELSREVQGILDQEFPEAGPAG